MSTLSTHAPAKINLTLSVLGRREDGYHRLESLVAFAGTRDTLTLRLGADLALRVEGPTAASVGPEHDNLVLKAARLLHQRIPDLRIGHFLLTKRLPVAAGIGGGSANAAATLRLLARANQLPLHFPAVIETARLTGADVPVCLESRARMMRGIGDELGPILKLPPLPCLLVNPRVALETRSVFQALAGEEKPQVRHEQKFEEALGYKDLIEKLKIGGNDLEKAACRLQPIILDALQAVSRTNECRLARMSGSGATVFGLYPDRRAALAAAAAIRTAHPHWWIAATILR